MSQVICEFCKTTLSSKYILKTHLVNNKACLAIRNLELKTNFVCKGCNQNSLDMPRLNIHQESCKSYKRLLLEEEHSQKLREKDKLLNDLKIKHSKEIKMVKEEYAKEMKDLHSGFEAERKTHQKEIKDLHTSFEKERETHEKTVKDLQAQIDKMFSTIENLAKQAIDKPNATTTINTNNVKNVYSDKYFLDKLTPEDIKHKCRNYLTEQVFFQGQRGIARMCTEHIIHTKDNKVLLTCTDVSRKKFKYIDEHGNMKEDYDARAFMEKVIGPIKQVSQEVYENILSDVKYEREELEHKKDLESMERKTALHYKTDMAADCYRQIIFIDNPDDNHEFRTELAINNHS